MRNHWRALALASLVAACARGAAPEHPLDHPREFVGRWVRLRDDRSWGDTLEYLADGRVLGSVGHPVPASARWGVRRAPRRQPEFCAADEREGYCQTYRFEGQTLVLGGGPNGPSYFRRAP